jgi:hypothetical protein
MYIFHRLKIVFKTTLNRKIGQGFSLAEGEFRNFFSVENLRID